jgi:hypothetical protein
VVNVNGERVRLGKSNGRGLLKVPTGHSSGETKQGYDKLQPIKPTEIQTPHFMNARLKPHRHTNVLDRNMLVLS